MTELKLYNNNMIQVDTCDFDYLVEVKEFFTEFVEGFHFMPKYRSGQWDGKISVFNKGNKTFPYGLLFEFIKFHKTKFPYLPLYIPDDIKALFKGDDVKGTYDLKYEPRDYQLECIEAAIKARNNIFVCGTAGGKCLSGVYVVVETSDDDYKKYFSDCEKI